jgi:hypothetical protein
MHVENKMPAAMLRCLMIRDRTVALSCSQVSKPMKLMMRTTANIRSAMIRSLLLTIEVHVTLIF